MGRRRELHGGRSLPLTSDINLINLVDVAFTLLVIFMITAPILQGGVEVRVPRAEVAPLKSTEALVVSIDRDEQIFIGDAKVSPEEFEGAIRDVWKQRGSPPVYVKADERASYGSVLRVIATLKASEIENVGLVAEPESPRRR